MSSQLEEEFGTIDHVDIELPGNRFDGQLGSSLADLIRQGLVRTIDLVSIHKTMAQT